MTGIGRLLEVGVAVDDVDAATTHFARALHAPVTEAMVEDAYFAMRFSMCRVGDVDFELMQSAGPDDLIGRFLARRGEGLHHICFLTDDADALFDDMRGRGLPVLSERPLPIDNLKAFFLHPRCLAGVLVEFVEGLHPWPQDSTPVAGAATDTDGVLAGGTIVGIGARVADLQAAGRAFADVLGADCAAPRPAACFGARTMLCRVGDFEATLIEDAAGRPGLDHVCLAVPDLDASLDRLRREGRSRIATYDADAAGRRGAFVRHALLHGTPFALSQG